MRQELLRPTLRLWVVAVAFYYPFFLGSQVLLETAPALVRGERPQWVQIGWLGVRAVSRGGGEVRSPGAAGGWLAAALAAGLILLAARRQRHLSGLAIVLLGQVAALPWLRRLWYRREFTPEVLLVAGALVFLVAVGLRRLTPEGPWWLRLGFLTASLPLPWAALWVVAGAPARAVTPPLVAVLAVAAVVSLWPAPPLPYPGWRTFTAGATLTTVALLTVWRAGPAVARANLAARRTALASAPPIPAGLPYPKLFFQKGVNFTAEWPDVYASEGARQALELLPPYGINAIALVPYGFASRDEPRVSLPGARGSWESDDGLEYLSRLAHQRGIRVLLKPQLWVGGGSYPGALEFPSAADRERWFSQYLQFVEHYARLATRIHADLFCVGVELSKMPPHEAQWRRLIARARELYPGPLVYAANFGSEFENLPFWDALDYLGLNNYYPLPDDLATGGTVARVETVQRRFGKPVVFTEAGFSSFQAPHREPWADTPRRLAPEDQARCYEALFQAFYRRPWFHGVYWWKVGTNRGGGPQDGSHTPWGKPAMQVLARWYLGGVR